MTDHRNPNQYRNSNRHDKKGSTNMTATNKNQQKPVNQKPNTPPPATTTASADPKPSGETAAKPKKAKKARVRWVSPKDPTFWVRSFKDVTDKHGAPMDPWGNKMEARAAVAFGLSDEERKARKANKEAEKAAYDAMSDEQKAEFQKAKREARAKLRDEKKAREKAALVEQIKAEIAAGKL